MILFLKIAGYFTLSENVAVTRVLKIILRTGMTVAIILVYRDLRSRGAFAIQELETHRSGALRRLPFLDSFRCSGFRPWIFGTATGNDCREFVFAYYFVRSIGWCCTTVPMRRCVSHLLFSVHRDGTPGLLLGVILLPEKFIRVDPMVARARLGGYLMNPQ